VHALLRESCGSEKTAVSDDGEETGESLALSFFFFFFFFFIIIRIGETIIARALSRRGKRSKAPGAQFFGQMTFLIKPPPLSQITRQH
jgi:hypothetical protein